MALLLRAITPRPDPIVEIDQWVRVDAGDLSAWASEVPNAEVTFDRQDLLEHHRLVSKIFGVVDASLPARFPSWFEEAQLRSRHAELSAGLKRVSGCCELAVTATWVAPQDAMRDHARIASGRAYLLQRQQIFAADEKRLDRANRLVDRLERDLGDRLVDVRRRVCPSPSVALSLALLVRRADVEAVQSALGGPVEDVRILLNGPWPPYSFASVEPEQGDG